MTQAVHDPNGIPAVLGASATDGVTPTPLYLDPTFFSLVVDDNTTGSNLSTNIAKRDLNNIRVTMGVSSADGVTPVMIYIDPSTKKLLINSN